MQIENHKIILCASCLHLYSTLRCPPTELRYRGLIVDLHRTCASCPIAPWQDNEFLRILSSLSIWLSSRLCSESSSKVGPPFHIVLHLSIFLQLFLSPSPYLRPLHCGGTHALPYWSANCQEEDAGEQAALGTRSFFKPPLAL